MTLFGAGNNDNYTVHVCQLPFFSSFKDVQLKANANLIIWQYSY